MPNKAETFARSETHINLMRAFAGESQARNRYTIAAGMAREKNLYVVQQAFLFTADQELTHAKQFYRQLADLSGQTVRADGTYPVDLYPDLLSHLRAAQHNEFQEWEHDYAHFADVAREEGFSEIAKTFDMIADIEKVLDEAIFLKEGTVFAHRSVDEIRENEGMSVDAYFREVFKC